MKQCWNFIRCDEHEEKPVFTSCFLRVCGHRTERISADLSSTAGGHAATGKLGKRLAGLGRVLGAAAGRMCLSGWVGVDCEGSCQGAGWVRRTIVLVVLTIHSPLHHIHAHCSACMRQRESIPSCPVFRGDCSPVPSVCRHATLLSAGKQHSFSAHTTVLGHSVVVQSSFETVRPTTIAFENRSNRTLIVEQDFACCVVIVGNKD